MSVSTSTQRNAIRNAIMLCCGAGEVSNTVKMCGSLIGLKRGDQKIHKKKKKKKKKEEKKKKKQQKPNKTRLFTSILMLESSTPLSRQTVSRRYLARGRKGTD